MLYNHLVEERARRNFELSDPVGYSVLDSGVGGHEQLSVAPLANVLGWSPGLIKVNSGASGVVVLNGLQFFATSICWPPLDRLDERASIILASGAGDRQSRRTSASLSA